MEKSSKMTIEDVFDTNLITILCSYFDLDEVMGTLIRQNKHFNFLLNGHVDFIWKL